MAGLSFARGDIVWVGFSPHQGHEQGSHRPALVISPQSYNERSSVLLACPITSNAGPWPWKVVLPQGGVVEGAVLIDQIRAIDPIARQVRTSGDRVEDALMADILARLATLVG